MVLSSSGSSHFVGLLNPKYEGSFGMSETVCPVKQCSIPEALIFQHDVLPFPTTGYIANKPCLRYELFLLKSTNSVPIAKLYVCVCVYYNTTLPLCKS